MMCFIHVTVLMLSCCFIFADISELTDLADSYDYVIVGAGTSGAVLASRLSENPDVSVLLIEAGGATLPVSDGDVVGILNDYWNTSVNWNYLSEPQQFSHLASKNRVSRLSSGKVLGGSTVTNGLQYARGCRHDYDAWASEGCTGWGYKSVLPYFLKSENILSSDLQSSPHHSSGGFLHVSDSNHALLSNIFVHSGEQLGYNITDHNGDHVIGFSPFYGTFRKGERSTTHNGLLQSVLHRPNIHVLTDSVATKIIFDGNKASGVRFVKEDQEHTVTCNNEVLLAAGPIGSAKLLMLSGVGPAAHLQTHGIPLVSDRPVGQNLQDHVMFPVWANTQFTGYVRQTPGMLDWLKYSLFGTGGLSEPVYSGTCFYSTNGRTATEPDIMLNLAPYKMSMKQLSIDVRNDILQEVTSASQGPGVTFAVALLKPESRGEVRLRSRNYKDTPLINPNYLQAKEDIRTLIQGISLVHDLLDTQSFKMIKMKQDNSSFSFCDSHTFKSPQYWECVIRHLAVTMNHHAGTCKMGKEQDPSAVVDPKLRVIGTEGLRVVDSSIIPQITSGGGNAPNIMIAEKAADMIKSGV